MFKIGAFSKICQVLVKALRHWDELGLLKPARTDSLTGFANWTGDWHADDNEFIGYSNRAFDEDGNHNERGAREVFFDIEADRFSWRYEVTEDSGETWEEVWTLEYTRKSE
jgi:hypothetical protein